MASSLPPNHTFTCQYTHALSLDRSTISASSQGSPSLVGLALSKPPSRDMVPEIRAGSEHQLSCHRPVTRDIFVAFLTGPPNSAEPRPSFAKASHISEAPRPAHRSPDACKASIAQQALSFRYISPSARFVRPQDSLFAHGMTSLLPHQIRSALAPGRSQDGGSVLGGSVTEVGPVDDPCSLLQWVSGTRVRGTEIETDAASPPSTRPGKCTQPEGAKHGVAGCRGAGAVHDGKEAWSFPAPSG